MRASCSLFIGRGGALLPRRKTGHGQEPEAETIAQLVAATLARLYGRPDDSFSRTYLASEAQSVNPQQVGRLCLRVLDQAKKVLDLIYQTSDIGR